MTKKIALTILLALTLGHGYAWAAETNADATGQAAQAQHAMPWMGMPGAAAPGYPTMNLA